MPGPVAFTILVLSIVIGSVPNAAFAQEAMVELKPGDKAASWEKLPGTDGREHSMEELADRDVIVVCFTCNSCPYSIDYEDRLKALHKKYQDAGKSVSLVAINSNSGSADELEKMKERASEKEFGFLYLRDAEQTVAKAYGALFTPEFFVMNRDREIVYRGAMDDVTDASKVQVRYVELAIESALKGEKPETASVPARGCGVRYKKVRRQKPAGN